MPKSKEEHDFFKVRRRAIILRSRITKDRDTSSEERKLARKDIKELKKCKDWRCIAKIMFVKANNIHKLYEVLLSME